jgi:hypothetical protein
VHDLAGAGHLETALRTLVRLEFTQLASHSDPLSPSIQPAA